MCSSVAQGNIDPPSFPSSTTIGRKSEGSWITDERVLVAPFYLSNFAHPWGMDLFFTFWLDLNQNDNFCLDLNKNDKEVKRDSIKGNYASG